MYIHAYISMYIHIYIYRYAVYVCIYVYRYLFLYYLSLDFNSSMPTNKKYLMNINLNPEDSQCNSVEMEWQVHRKGQ